MVRVKNLVAFVALSSVMYGAGVISTTVALSYLPMVNASSTSIAQGLKQSKSEEVDEKRNLKFQIQNCKRSGKYIVCDVLATNLKNENQRIQFFASTENNSRVIDVSGNEYPAKLIKIGQTENPNSINTQLIGGVPLKISLSFETPSEVTKLAVVELGYWTSQESYGRVPLRDITIGGASQASNPGNPEKCPPQKNPKRPGAR